MKKILLTVSLLGFLAASQVQTARAGDREWAVAGKVLTGIAAASIITHGIEPAPVYYAQPAYCPPPPVVYYQPAPPVVVYRPPVYVRPAPVFGFGFYFGRDRHFERHEHGRW